MKKEFSVNLLLLLGLNLLVKPLYIFGIDVQVQNTIGPEQYGLFFSIFNYTLIFQILLEFGITNLVKRESRTKIFFQSDWIKINTSPLLYIPYNYCGLFYRI